jgi:hypothetical protein
MSRTRTLVRFSIPLLGSAALALGMFACSSDSTTPSGTGGAGTDAGKGGATSSSGGKGGTTSTSGGSTSAGGASAGGASAGGGGGAGGAGADPYACQAAKPRDPGGTVMANGDCCSTALGKVGTCMALASVTGDADMKAALGHDSCDKTLVCAPKAGALDAHPDAGVYETCTAKLGTTAGYEGRCLPKCFVAGNPQAPLLAQESCASAEMVCAPCFNPIDGKPTGACTQKTGDHPATTAPKPYQACGAFDGGTQGGICVPKVLVDASGNASAGSLLQDDCANATDRCVPTLKAKDTAACFAKCTTTLGALNTKTLDFKPGACVPAYIVRDVNPAGLGLLKKDTCTGADELCAPCLDPLSMPVQGVATHSCE